MDPDDIHLISFFNANRLSEDAEGMSADIGEEQTNRLSLNERYRNWFEMIDL
ncbi:MAG: hypothetical protein JW822_01450 [Spirochaetales bacterium]|nr:hypothetical protein [Spirochaetales bacterium]